MTTREIYFKAVISIDLPIGIVGYVYKDKNGVIQIGKSICLNLRTDEETVAKSIKQMKDVEKSKGFMFWNISSEGEEFFKDNWSTIGKGLSNIIINQK